MNHAGPPGDYQDQIRAWRDEQARLAARPWWRKASDAVQDFAAIHSVALWATAISVAAVLVLTLVFMMTR